MALPSMEDGNLPTLNPEQELLVQQLAAEEKERTGLDLANNIGYEVQRILLFQPQTTLERISDEIQRKMREMYTPNSGSAKMVLSGEIYDRRKGKI